MYPDVKDETERVDGRRGDLDGLLRSAGYRDVALTELSVRIAYRTFDEWWEPYAPGGDVAVLRRYLVDHGILERTRSGSEYALARE